MSFDESDKPQGRSAPSNDSGPDSSTSFTVSDDPTTSEHHFTGNTSSTSFSNPNVNPSINNPSKPRRKPSISSSFFPNRGTVIEIQEDGEPIRVTRPYGVGIDTHKCFLAVTVIVNSELQYIRFQQDFPTTSEGILLAKVWALDIIQCYCNPPIDDNEPLHYTIESTATMHYLYEDAHK